MTQHESGLIIPSGDDVDLLKRAPLFPVNTLAAGRYKIAERLSVHTLADVYLAHDIHNNGARVALKTFKESGEGVRRQVDAEFAAHLLLSHEAGVIPVYDVGVLTNRGGRRQRYLATEFAAGGSYADRIKYHHTHRTPTALRIRDAIQFGLDLSPALIKTHADGIVHKDVKPENGIFLNRIRRFVLSDFGIADIVDPDKAIEDAEDPEFAEELAKLYADADTVVHPNTGRALFSPRYMAPEMARGEEVSSATDTCELANSIFVGITGGPGPVVWDNPETVLQRVGHDEPIPLTRFVPDAPQGLSHLLQRAQAPLPEDRPSDQEFADELRTHLSYHSN